MELLGKSENKDSGYFELYWDDVLDQEGKKYQVVCCRDGNQAIFGVVYSANSKIHPSYFASFNAKYVPVNNPNYTSYGYKINRDTTIYSVFNSAIQKGFISFNFERTGGSGGLNYLNWYSSPFLPETTVIATPFLGTWNSVEFWQNVNNIPAPKLPWQDASSTTGGGKGNWDDDTTEPINPPSETDLNTEQLTDTFFMQTYRLRKSELQALGRLLWTPTVTQALSSVFKNPLESIINLFMLPFDKHRTEYKNILLGTYDTGIGGFLVDQYATIDCGVIDIPEKWGGSLDYESRIQLYLPFIGTKEVDITEVMGGQLGVKYIVDVLTGACVAYVAVKRGDLEAVLYQFTGNCAYSFPLTQANYNTFYSALLSSTAAVATGIATGGASTPMLVGAGASVAASAKVHVNHSGNLAGNTGYMGIKKPYIILSRPIQALPADFGKYKGYQSHITKKLSDCKGYTEVEYIHLDGISRATSAELSQIESLLKGGVIIS